MSEEDVIMEEEEVSRLPKNIEEKRTRVRIGVHAPSDTITPSYHSSYKALGFDNSFNIAKWKKGLKIKVIKKNDEEMIFDMIGIDAALANSFRRIMIAEVPTVAIEKVVYLNNTGIIPDEILAHRIGLVPIHVDPRFFAYKATYENDNKRVMGEMNGEAWNEKAYKLYQNQILLFKLDVTCKKNPNSDEPINSKVYSSHLQWVPIGSQAEAFKENPPRPVHKDILLAKLRPGQTITAHCYCEKGLGKTHAKWSPVATATYRLLPEITFLQDVEDEKAEELKKKCPMNVFDIEDMGGSKKAVVARPRDCTMCRECIREEGWDQYVKLNRKRDHFIFSIESTGIYRPQEVFTESIKVLYDKCDQTIKQLKEPSTENME